MSTSNVANFDFTLEFNEILERIKLSSPEITKGDSDIARALDVSRTTPSTWRRRNKLPLEAIVDYAKKKEINIHWLLTGEGEQRLSHMSTNDKAQYSDNADVMYLDDAEADNRVQKRNVPIDKKIKEASDYINETLTLESSPKDYELVKTMLFKLAIETNCKLHELESFIDYLNHQSDQNGANEFAMIPGYNIQVSAGHGAINGEEQPTRYLAFRKKWLKYRGFTEKDLVVVFAKGDSMEPTIANNNSLLILTNVESIQDGGIYVIRQDDTLLVKRVQRLLDGNLKLISDNAAYEPMILTKDSFESLDVVGQVVWIAKDIG
jgi:phage repressor protein C with HTH and peptisase S24 domain